MFQRLQSIHLPGVKSIIAIGGKASISCYGLYKYMWDKWNYFSITCSTDKPPVKVPGPFDTCKFGKEVARIMSRWEQQKEQSLSENLRKLQVKEIELFL